MKITSERSQQFGRSLIGVVLAIALANAQTLHGPGGYDEQHLRKVEGGVSWYEATCVWLAARAHYDVHRASKILDPSLDASIAVSANYEQPSVEQIRAAIQAETTCTLPNPQQLALTDDLRANHAITEHYARHMPASFTANSDVDQRLLRALRLQGKFTPATVFEIGCRQKPESAYLHDLTELSPGPVVVTENLAWVPILTAKREMTGLGLLFSFSETWQYAGLTGSGVPHHFIRWLRERHQSADYVVEDDDEFLARCPMPEAPEPTPWSDDLWVPRYPGFVEKDQGDDGANILGSMKRLAILQLASEKSAPATTKALHAEVLLQSLAFDGAPKPGTAAWVARVHQAQELMESAAANGADMRRIAPFIRWLAIRHITGEPGFKQDLVQATRLLKIAAEFDDSLSKSILYGIGIGQIEICPDHYLPDTAYPTPEAQVESQRLRPCNE